MVSLLGAWSARPLARCEQGCARPCSLGSASGSGLARCLGGSEAKQEVRKKSSCFLGPGPLSLLVTSVAADVS